MTETILILNRYLYLWTMKNFADIWVCAHKNITCMHASLCAYVTLCTQIGPVCSPDSIDTLISLIQLNLTEIWACACKHVGCMHAGLWPGGEVCTQRGLAWSPYSIDTFIFLINSNLAEICMQAHSVHACCIACLGCIIYSNRSG